MMWKHPSHHHPEGGGWVGQWWEKFPKMGICIRQSFLYSGQSGKAKCSPPIHSQMHPTYAPSPLRMTLQGNTGCHKNQDACFPIPHRSCRWCVCSLVIYGAMWKPLVSVLLKLQEHRGQSRGNLSKNQDFCWGASVMMVCIWEAKWHSWKQTKGMQRGPGCLCSPGKKNVQYLKNGSANFHIKYQDVIPWMPSRWWGTYLIEC